MISGYCKMKNLRFVTFPIILLFILACSVQLPSVPTTTSLALSLQFDQESFASFDEIQADVVVQNISDKDILVNGRLAFVPVKWPSQFIEGVFLVTDSTGNSVTPNAKIDIDRPSEKMFIILKPGEKIVRHIHLGGMFLPDYFRTGELYNAVAIYQNSLDLIQPLDGKEIKAWKGEVQSNTATFKIMP
jgi:hypothetical protein